MKSWFKKDVLGFSLTSLFNDCAHEMAVVILPAYILSVHAAQAPLALGVMVGLADVVATAMKFIAGWLSTRINFFKPFLIIGYTLTPLFVGCIGFFNNLWQIASCLVFAWLGKGLREPLRDTWLANVTSHNQYGRVFGIQRAFDTIGAIIGPVLAYYLIQSVSLSACFFITFIPGLLSVFFLIVLTSSYKNINVHPHNSSWSITIGLLPTSFKKFLWILLVFSAGNFNKSLIVLHAQQSFFAESSSWVLATGGSILLYVVLNVVRACAEFGIGYLSDFYSRRLLMLYCGFVPFCAASLLLAVVSNQIFLWICIFAFVGLSVGVITTLEKSYTAQLVPISLRGTAYGFLQGINGIGSLVSSALVGLLWSYIGHQYAFIYAASTTALATLLMAYGLGSKTSV